MKFLFLVFLMFSELTLASAYDEAERKSSAFHSDKETVRWYEEEMQPSFKKIFMPALGLCLSKVQSNRPSRIDLVFVVDSFGNPSEIYWKEESLLGKCLEIFIKTNKFAIPPNEEFYFGIGFNVPAYKG